MKVAIAGGTGFIGRGLVDLLSGEGHEITVLSRDPDTARPVLGKRVAIREMRPDVIGELATELNGTDAIVNLAGENIGSSLWTRAKRIKIAASRIRAGQMMTAIVKSMKGPPGVFVQGSAVGFYGSHGGDLINENSPAGEGFLPEVCVKWEESTSAIEAMGVRRVIIRTGVVLSGDGGAFPKLALPYHLHVGTLLGTGRQWLPWIHYRDEINAIYFLIKNRNSAGTYNLVAPNPVQMNDLCSLLGLTIFKMPPRLVRLLLGQMGKETVLVSQRVVPERLLKENFAFAHSQLPEALESLK